MHDICHDSFRISTALVLHKLVKFQHCLVQVLKVSLPIPQTLTNCFLGFLNLAHSAEFQAAHVLLAIQLCEPGCLWLCPRLQVAQLQLLLVLLWASKGSCMQPLFGIMFISNCWCGCSLAHLHPQHRPKITLCCHLCLLHSTTLISHTK